MASIVLLAFIAFIVGFFCGCTSIGGILLIPAIVLLSPLNIHEAMGTALFSFGLMSCLGVFLHARRGTINWRQAVPICLGALLFGYAGARANAVLPPDGLRLILAALILFAGISTFGRGGRVLCDVAARSERMQGLTLFALGSFVGFMAGLTGIGGPVLSVPFMIGMGFAPLYSIAMGQPLQVIAGLSGSIANVAAGTIDYVMAAWITLLEFIGFYLGILLAYRLGGQTLRRIISVLCILTSCYLFLNG